MTPKVVVKRPCGSENRKRKKEGDEEINKLPKIFKYLSATCAENNESQPTSYAADNNSVSLEQDNQKNKENDNMNNVIENECESNLQVELCKNDLNENILPSSVSVDIGLYLGKEVNENLRKKILSAKPWQPQGPFPKNSVTGRSFSINYYYATTSSGQKILRDWLCYSLILDSVYCQACWLYANRSDKSFNDAWCKGSLNN